MGVLSSEHILSLKGINAASKKVGRIQTKIAASGRLFPAACDVAIVGGGLGGLALAAGLKQSGLDVHVFEAASALRTSTGTVAGLGRNAFKALGCLDDSIVDRLWGCGCPVHEVNREVRPPGKDPIVETGHPNEILVMQWQKIQSTLADLVDPNTVHCGARAVGYTELEGGPPGQEPPQVTLHFQDIPDVSTSLLVAADGVGSALRRQMVPDEGGPCYLGHMNWNALLHNPKAHPVVNLHKENNLRWIGLPDNTTSMYIIDAGGDRTFWQVRVQCDEPVFTAGGGRGGMGIPGSKQRVLDHLGMLGWHDLAEAVVATPEEDIFERGLVGRVPSDQWRSPGGQVVLLGDSAHAMHPGPGQGARTAFEDAHQLVNAIQQYWPDIPKVIQEYLAVRVPRTLAIQVASYAGCGAKEILDAIPLTKDPPDVRKARWNAFNRWTNAYPQHMVGLPADEGPFYNEQDVRYLSSEVVQQVRPVMLKMVQERAKRMETDRK